MYIIIPSILIIVSLVGIMIIVRRKMSYLRRLSPEAHSSGDNLFGDYFPELVGWFNGFKWHEYHLAGLREIEKVLRRMRLAVMKVDHVSDRMIKKVRKIHLTTHLEQTAAAVITEKQADKTEKVIDSASPAQAETMTHEELKVIEQELIIKIAQNPKDAELYENLGGLYVMMKSLTDARESYEAALDLKPDNKPLIRKYSALLKRIESVK